MCACVRARDRRIMLQVHAEDGDGPARRDMREVGQQPLDKREGHITVRQVEAV